VKVLFVKEVVGTARAGDVKEVSPGYARNFLLPKRLAVVADDRVVEQIKRREEATRRRVEKALTEARETAARLKKLTVTIYAKTGDSGRLFGSVTNADIADALNRIDFKVVKAQVRMPNGPLKTVGEFIIPIKLHKDVTAHLKVVIEKEAVAE